MSVIEAHHNVYRYAFMFFNLRTGEIHNESVHYKLDYERSHEAIDLALINVPRKRQNLEFVAKVLHVEEDLILATPIYVALAE